MCIAVCTIVHIANHVTTVTITTRLYRSYLSISMVLTNNCTSTVNFMAINRVLMDYIWLITSKA